ncbi:MAG: 30S ribosomal protein S13 [Caldisericia bacterium]|nr:30S ribosomal protein S13 [Caldisericia bacterium]
MARVVGVDLPKNKRIDIALTYIYGIGLSRAKEIIKNLNIDPNKKVKDLTPEEINNLNDYIPKHYKVEGDLRKEIASNIKRLIDINCYRGYRHKRGLPVRGQRTRTNARTRKGPRKTVGSK